MEAAISLFEQAVKADPSFALGFSTLGEAYCLKYRIEHDSHWLDEAEATTEPRPERNGALLLDITVGDPFATIDCRKVEHVRNGEEVIFSSNKKCKLVFDNNDPVFDEHEKEIGPGETTLRVTKYAQGWTHCSVDPLEDGKEIPKEFHSPPKIEVP